MCGGGAIRAIAAPRRMCSVAKGAPEQEFFLERNFRVEERCALGVGGC